MRDEAQALIERLEAFRPFNDANLDRDLVAYFGRIDPDWERSLALKPLGAAAFTIKADAALDLVDRFGTDGYEWLEVPYGIDRSDLCTMIVCTVIRSVEAKLSKPAPLDENDPALCEQRRQLMAADKAQRIVESAYQSQRLRMNKRP